MALETPSIITHEIKKTTLFNTRRNVQNTLGISSFNISFNFIFNFSFTVSSNTFTIFYIHVHKLNKSCTVTCKVIQPKSKNKLSLPIGKLITLSVSRFSTTA